MRRSLRIVALQGIIVLAGLLPYRSVSGQLFQRPPCPQFISSGVLGYDGFITFEGVYFPVASLYHLTPGQSDVIYRPVPERPQTKARAWELAAVGATCYYWLTPLGDLWTVVEETAKYGYVKKLIACDGSVEPPLADVTLSEVYADGYDPMQEDESDCDDSEGGGGGTGSGDCHQEWIVIEISYDDGATWEVLWEGYATVCE